MISTQNPKVWWSQFPEGLRLVAKGRLYASIGAGAVLYLTPLLFNNVGFSASQIGTGVTVAALSGTFARIVSGFFLDKKINFWLPLRIAACLAILADLLLLQASNYIGFLQGQFLLGAAAGTYWPSVELAVPINCGTYPSSKGFALVRAADALGICFGASLGTVFSSINQIRYIYYLDIFFMLLLLRLLIDNKIFIENLKKDTFSNKNYLIEDKKIKRSNLKKWLSNIIPILIISLFATSIFTLLQSALPLDLVKGGLERPALSDTISGLILALQLGLILLFQWPVGKVMSEKGINYGLNFSLTCLGLGCLLISLSSLFKIGITIVILALFFIALGITAFLPTATEGIVKNSSISRRGISMALFSQCFGISAIVAPIIAGYLLDKNSGGFILWISLSFIALLLVPLAKKINPTNQVN